MPRTIDLNADLGEDDSPSSAAILSVVTSANVACGVHAGDPLIMYRTLAAAADRGVVAGAHPSYPDRENFGRKSMFGSPHAPLSAAELHAVIAAQLATFSSLSGGPIPYIKPHGALYNDAQVNWSTAQVVANQAMRVGAAVMGQPGSVLNQVCVEYQVPYIAEVFADRGYAPDGTLIPRTLPHALHTSPHAVARRVVGMVTEGTVEAHGLNSASGTYETTTLTFPQVNSVCVHGDTPGAFDIACAVRAALEDAGVTLHSPLATKAPR